MALTWDISKIDGKDDLCWVEAPEDEPMRGIVKGEKYLNPLTECMIFMTLATGIGRITLKNAAEFYARVSFLEDLQGNMLVRPADENGVRAEGLDARITAEEVWKHIGLVTNASFKDETRAVWLKRFNRDLDSAKARFNRQLTTAIQRMDAEAVVS